MRVDVDDEMQNAQGMQLPRDSDAANNRRMRFVRRREVFPVEVDAARVRVAAARVRAPSRRTYQKSDAPIPPELDAKLRSFFDKMDADQNGEVSREEAVAFWGKNFAKVNAQSMFNEVDEDGNDHISWEEFRKFWQVRTQRRARRRARAALAGPLSRCRRLRRARPAGPRRRMSSAPATRSRTSPRRST